MQRTFNYTNRKKIKSEEYKITLVESDDGECFFKAELSFKENIYPHNAKVVVEAYRKNTLQRFDFGVIEKIEAPKSTLIDKFDAYAGGVLFNLKIVDSLEGSGKLIATAERITPVLESTAAANSSLLPVKLSDLDEVLWRIEFSKDLEPVLLLNKKVPGILERLKSDSILQAAIFPAVIREILTYYGSNSQDEEFDTKWMDFANSHVPKISGEDDEVFSNWVDEVVEKFCKKHVLSTRLVHQMEKE